MTLSIKETIEELENIVENAPVFAGKTISHATANECVNNGWAERNENGDFVPTEAGRRMYQVMQLKALKLTDVEAATLVESRYWEGRTAREIAEFQLAANRWTVPFDVLHKAVTEALGRDVWSHELLLDREALLAELRDERPTRTRAEIFGSLSGRFGAENVAIVELEAENA